jgi:transcriptional regulator with XRE-family HTH domain
MIPITSPDTLGKVLRSYRKEQGLTQHDAGKKFNILQSSISGIESGRPGVRLETVFRYMSALSLEMHLEPRVKPVNDKGLW